MPPTLFVGIPSYADRPALHETVRAIQSTAKVSHQVEIHVQAQDLVKNKNIILQKARESGAEFICISDDDVEPLPGWDEGLIDGIRTVEQATGRKVGQTTPLLLYPDGTIFCTWMNVRFDRYKQRQEVIAVAMGQLEESRYHCVIEAGALPGTLSIFTRAALDRLDWRFDLRYPKSQHEDVDQSLECRGIGFICLYNGKARAIHHTQRASPRASEENWQRLVAKWKTRFDLSLVVEPESEAIASAVGRLCGPAHSGRGAVAWLSGLVRRLRGSRLVYRNYGLRGVYSHLWYK